jgi:hypothetical protein
MSTVATTAASLEHGEYMEYYKNITRYHRISKIHQRPERQNPSFLASLNPAADTITSSTSTLKHN